MSFEQSTQFNKFTYALFLRCMPGICALYCLHKDELLAAGILLIVASLGDLIVDSLATRQQWNRSPFNTQIEGFVDFTCFIWAPAELILTINSHWIIICGLAAFITSGIFRLARFNIQGIQHNSYVGLPVTYNGLIFPALAWGSEFLSETKFTFGITLTLLLLSLFMSSDRFKTKRISI